MSTARAMQIMLRDKISAILAGIKANVKRVAASVHSAVRPIKGSYAYDVTEMIHAEVLRNDELKQLEIKLKEL